MTSPRHNKKPLILLLGTDPRTGRGGVSSALRGFEAALGAGGFDCRLISTHHDRSALGKLIPFWVAFFTLGLVLLRCKFKGRVAVVYAHGGDWPSLLRKLSLLLWARLWGAKTLLHLHSQSVDSYLRNRLSAATLQQFLRLSSNAVLVLSPWWKERFVSCGFGHPIFVVPNPVSHTLEAVAAKQGSRPAPPRQNLIRILTMARFVPGKGVEAGIAALSHLPDNYHLILAGDGVQRELLEKLAQDLKVQGRVHFVGWVFDEEKASLLSSADVFCLPTRYESFGMGFVEAMAFGLPVVALDWGPIPDIVPHGEVGLLIREQDPTLVAEAIELICRSSEFEKMQSNAKDWVIKNFSSSTVGQQLKEIIEETLSA